MGISINSRFYLIALSPTGNGISGGDRVFIELARQWSQSLPVTIYTASEGVVMAKRFNLSGDFLDIINIGKKRPSENFFHKYFYKIYLGIKLSLSFTINNQPSTVIYSSSEFWMDSLPCFILKLRFPNITWVASWYQTAPNPLTGYTQGKRSNTYKIGASLYWITQLPIKPIIDRFANFVIVTNDTEKKQFLRLSRKNRVLVMYGGVDIGEINKYRKKYHNLPKEYDAVFQGRFHPQKGVVELIEIWKKVVKKNPFAKLVMIGDGPLMKRVKCKVQSAKLKNNVLMTGYLFDGEEKYRIFSQSKIVVHPAFYDSGGMSAGEAMAFGLPCVGFDLKAYKSYYPKGMIKIKVGDLDAFAVSICRLLEDNDYRSRVGDEALQMINSTWSWEDRSKGVLDKIINGKI